MAAKEVAEAPIPTVPDTVKVVIAPAETYRTICPDVLLTGSVMVAVDIVDALVLYCVSVRPTVLNVIVDVVLAVING